MSGANIALWFSFLLPFVYYAGRGLRQPVALFAPPVIVSFGFVGIYIINYLVKPQWVLDRFLLEPGYQELLILAAISLGLFILGYEIGVRTGRPTAPIAVSQSIVELWSFILLIVAFSGLSIFVVASGGFVAFFSAAHGTGGAWEETSAYLYNLPLFMFPAAYLLLAQWMKGDGLSTLAKIAFIGTMIYLVFQAVVFGNRGDTIRVCLMIGLSALAFRRDSRLVVLGILSVAAVSVAAVLIFPYVRDALHLGASMDVSGSLKTALDTERINANVSGDELFYATAVLVSVQKFEFYTFGLGWLIPILNFIPRFVWPAKHQFFAACCLFDLMGSVQRVAGYEVAGGSAYTGLVDGFIQWWWFSPIIWMGFGLWGGRWYKRVIDSPDVFNVGYVFAYDTALVYWVTQDFRAAFYPLLFIAVPIWILRRLQSRLGPARKRPPIFGTPREGDQSTESGRWRVGGVKRTSPFGASNGRERE